jgi:hypothetical protein
VDDETCVGQVTADRFCDVHRPAASEDTIEQARAVASDALQHASVGGMHADADGQQVVDALAARGLLADGTDRRQDTDAECTGCRDSLQCDLALRCLFPHPTAAALQEPDQGNDGEKPQLHNLPPGYQPRRARESTVSLVDDQEEPDQGNGDTEGWEPLLGAWVTGTIMPDNQRAGEEMTGAWFGWGTDEHRVGWIDDEIGTISSIWPVRPDTLRPATEAKGQDPEVWAEAQRNAAELGAVYRAAKAAGGSDLDAIREIHRAVQDRGEVRPAIDEGTREDRDEH